MSLKEISDLIKDLIESQKQLTLRLKMIEIEIINIKENLPGRITNIIEKTEKIDKRISQKYINELLNKKSASASTYQKGSMDEILIQKFLEKQKLKEKDLYKIFDSGKEMMPYLEKYYQKLPGFWAKYFREEYVLFSFLFYKTC